MTASTRASALLFALAALLAGPAAATAEVTLLTDLTSAIKVLNLPCGQVMSAKRQADNEHIATCRNGNRYRVFVTPDGRIVAQKQKT